MNRKRGKREIPKNKIKRKNGTEGKNCVEESTKMAGCERYRDKLAGVCLFDDDFMTKCFDEHPECVEQILRTVLEKPDLRLREARTQCFVKNLQGKSVRLDIYAVDANGCCYDVEMQRKSDGARPQRARYNSAILDANYLEPAKEFKELPESYIIFITEKDIRGEGRARYRIERSDADTGKGFDDRLHIIYVNGEYRDDSPIGLLMHDLFCTKAEEMHNKVLAERVRYFKETEEGMKCMCKIWDDIREEGREEGRKEGIQEGKIEMLVLLSREQGKPDAYIVEEIVRLLQVDAERAKEYLQDCAV